MIMCMQCEITAVADFYTEWPTVSDYIQYIQLHRQPRYQRLFVTFKTHVIFCGHELTPSEES